MPLQDEGPHPALSPTTECGGTNLLMVPGSYPLGASASSDSVCSAVITLDQIKRKAEEIVERKNSFCSSSRVATEGSQDLDGEDSDDTGRDLLEADHENDDDELGTPKCQSPEASDLPEDLNNEADVTCGTTLESPLRGPSPLDIDHDAIVITDSSEPTTPKVSTNSLDNNDHQAVVESEQKTLVPIMPLHEQVVAARSLLGKSAAVCMDIDGLPLWQATERTITPLWELATNNSATNSNSPAFGSSDVSKSNSELSLKNLGAGGYLSLQGGGGGGGGGVGGGGGGGHGSSTSTSSSGHYPNYYHNSAAKLFLTSKLSITDDSGSSSSPALPLSKHSNEGSDISSWENNSVTDESVNDEAVTVATAAPGSLLERPIDSSKAEVASWENNSITDESVREELAAAFNQRGSVGRESRESMTTVSSDEGQPKDRDDSSASPASSSHDPSGFSFKSDIDTVANLRVSHSPEMSLRTQQGPPSCLPDFPPLLPCSEASEEAVNEAEAEAESRSPSPGAEKGKTKGPGKRKEAEKAESAPTGPPRPSVDNAEGEFSTNLSLSTVPPPPPKLSRLSYGLQTSPKPFRRPSLPVKSPTAASNGTAKASNDPTTSEFLRVSSVIKSEGLFDEIENMVDPGRRAKGPRTRAAEARGSGNDITDSITADLDSLLTEVNEHIHFSAPGDDKTGPASSKDHHDHDNSDEFSQVRSDLSEVRRDLSMLKDDLSTAKHSLDFNIVTSLVEPSSSISEHGKDASPTNGYSSAIGEPILPRDSKYLSYSLADSVDGGSRKSSKEMEEVEKAMTQLAKTISEFHSSTSDPKVSTYVDLMHSMLAHRPHQHDQSVPPPTGDLARKHLGGLGLVDRPRLPHLVS